MTAPSKTRARAPAVEIRPLMVSHDAAAAMLGQISPRLLDELVAQGRIVPRRISGRRIGYRLRDLEAFCDSLPPVTPGRQEPAADPTAP